MKHANKGALARNYINAGVCLDEKHDHDQDICIR